MTLPTFLIIGAARSGTSSLYQYLAQHPQIYMSPEKEPLFFIYEGRRFDLHGPGSEEIERRVVCDLDSYRELFRGASGHAAIGEASTSYLYDPVAPGRIQHHLPDVRLIAILRNPVARAYSAFLYLIRLGHESCSDFAAALRAEEERIRARWRNGFHYRRGGLYCQQLRRYFDRFPAERIKVCIHEDFIANPVRFCHDIFRFLNVDCTFVPDTSTQYNAARRYVAARNKAVRVALEEIAPLHRLAKRVVPRSWHPVFHTVLYREFVPPPLSQDLRDELRSFFRPEILDLQQLLHRDLSCWLDD
ncbi:MAG: sulfotransferase [Acidobacteria bacterium]|nr:sulfotransferase [Acidobacteriota bacterium]